MHPRGHLMNINVLDGFTYGIYIAPIIKFQLDIWKIYVCIFQPMLIFVGLCCTKYYFFIIIHMSKHLNYGCRLWEQIFSISLIKAISRTNKLFVLVFGISQACSGAERLRRRRPRCLLAGTPGLQYFSSLRRPGCGGAVAGAVGPFLCARTLAGL